MGVPVKATCSECLTAHFTKLEFDQEHIKCPACGHTLNNLPDGELNELETVLKKQRTHNIIALVAFTITVFCFFEWVFTMNREDVDPWMWGTIVFLLVTLVFGVLGSLKRFIVEF